MRKYTKQLKVILPVLLCIGLVVSAISFSSLAENVVMEEYINPELQFVAIHGTDNNSKNAWEPKGSFSQDPAAGKYAITSNAFAPWFTQDSVHFAYKEMNFAYGSSGTLTLETQLDSWTATASPNAGAGIMLRTSLDPGAANVIFHIRPNMIMVQYRAIDNNGSIRGKTVESAARYPVKLKIELNRGKAVCYKQEQGERDYAQFASIPFVCGDKVFAGLAAWSQYETEMGVASFTGYTCRVTAPEGTGPVTSGSTSEDTSSEEVIELPEDPTASPDVLMRETFTDGMLTTGTAQYPDAPVWKIKNAYTPQVVTNADNTNRYLYDWMESKAYYFAGDQSWTDYTLSMDLTFTSEFSDEAENEVYIYFRHTDIMQYGVHNYGLGFKNGKMFITKRMGGTFDVIPSQVSTGPTSKPVYYEYAYDYLGEESIGVTHKLQIKAFDNVITVFWDGQQVIQYTDESSSVLGKGSIGFMVNNAAVQIDNIVVTDELDLMGGDYDNYILGNWDQPIPELVQEFDKNDWNYGSTKIKEEE